MQSCEYKANESPLVYNDTIQGMYSLGCVMLTCTPAKEAERESIQLLSIFPEA